MNYALTPSLEHRAVVEITTTLWNQDDIRALITGFSFLTLKLLRREQWQEIEDKVVEKVLQLPQPEPFKEKILSFVKPIGLQILHWMKYNDQNSYLDLDPPNDLCWTAQGTVDTKKTAEMLIKNEKLDITRRYKLACTYCFEDYIPELWNKIPENRRKSFYNDEDPRRVRQSELVLFWTYDIKGEVKKLDNMTDRWLPRICSVHQHIFEYAVIDGNKPATVHFFRKLTPKEREESVVRCARHIANRRIDSARSCANFVDEHYTDILCFLLSQMDEEQQTEIFKSNSFRVLQNLIDWPRQSFFMETAKRLWDFLPEKYYDTLLKLITDKILDGYKDFNYHKLFEQFWQQSPCSHKRFVIHECQSGSLLSNLLKIEDEENVKLILKDATNLEREKIIFSYRGKNACESLIYDNKWDFLKFFIEECMLWKEVLIQFKDEFKKHIIRRHPKEKLEKEKDMWSKFFLLLDNFIDNMEVDD